MIVLAFNPPKGPNQYQVWMLSDQLLGLSFGNIVKQMILSGFLCQMKDRTIIIGMMDTYL